MRKKSYIFLMVVGLLFHSCKDDDSVLGKDVVFSGEVLYDDTMESIDGVIQIFAFENNFLVNNINDIQEALLEEGEKFEFSFDSSLEIDYFNVEVEVVLEEGTTPVLITNCSGFEDCDRLPKNGNYKGMTILVERPE